MGFQGQANEPHYSRPLTEQRYSCACGQVKAGKAWSETSRDVDVVDRWVGAALHACRLFCNGFLSWMDMGDEGAMVVYFLSPKRIV